MRSRFVAGWKGLVLAAAMAGLFLLPVGVLAKTAPTTAVGGNQGVTAVPEENQPLKPMTLYARSNYTWPYAAGPTYGQVDDSQWSARGVLHFAVGSFDSSRGVPNFPAELRTGVKLDKLPAQYFVLQLDPDSLVSGSSQALRHAIETNGGALVSNLAVAGFIARLTPGAYAAIQGTPGLIFVEPYHPAFKLSPAIGRSPLPDPVKAVSNVYSLVVSVFNGEDSHAVAQVIAKLGGNVTSIGPDEIRVDIAREKLAQIASIEAVQMVFEDVPNFPQGEETTTTMQTGHWNLGAIPYHDAGIDGGGGGLATGQTLMVLDSGIQIDAGDLSNTKTDASVAGPNHRKVRNYQTTNTFAGGSGDLLGCDAPLQGGFTHGHIVSATALGNATATPVSYGGSWFATDTSQNQWKLDGVAPRAKLVAYDANVTNTTVSCDDPAVSGIAPGNLYTSGAVAYPSTCSSPGSGSLSDAWCNYGARVFNFSWGSQTPGTYSADCSDIDNFMFQAKDAVVFVSAGNSSADTDRNGIPDPGTIGTPATAKNAVVVGASYETNDGGADYTKLRAGFSSIGPATVTSNRVAPLLMAPGNDGGGLGLASEFACRTNDNDQNNPVQCDISQGLSGTSFSSPAAAGAGLLVRDYFAQGFYPDGTSSNPNNASDQVPAISAALLKAILIDSADFLTYPNIWGQTCGNQPNSRNPSRYRFNNEQGYGRIELNNALPIQTYTSPIGMIVADGGIPGGKNNMGSISGTATAGSTETYTFNVSDTSKELRVALAWIEDSGDALTNNLDLELDSPTGRIYYGNYFTDDNNKNRQLDAGEDCGGTNWTVAGQVDSSQWSLPTCANSVRDTQNPTEAIFLSPQFNCEASNPNSQMEAGTWTLKVIGRTVPAGSQAYAVALVGPVQLGSSVGIDVHRQLGGNDTIVTDLPACNDRVGVVVNEFDEVTDPLSSLTPTIVGSRTTIQVYDSTNALVDQEAGSSLAWTQVGSSGKFTSSLLVLTDGTARDFNNGALDVRDGDTIKVTYQDFTNPPGGPDANKVRTSSKKVNCRAGISFGGVVFAKFGQNGPVAINGGCERDARNQFYWDAPDQYMDHGELIDFRMAISAGDTVDLEDAVATLSAVYTDADSPAACKPYSTTCTDPNRLNNTPIPSSILNVLDSPKVIGLIPTTVQSVPQAAATAPVLTVNFTIQMGNPIAGMIKADMILGVSAKKSGKPVSGLAIARTTLNAQESAQFYSTDFPTGGTQIYDWNNNESIENPTRFLGDTNFTYDYRFETVTWSDLTAGGTRNTAISAPWNFDSNNGGFRSGLNGTSNPNIATAIALWGEDKNFNNILDTGEDRDPVNGSLDQNWNTLGGCGWQTKGTNTAGGAWHTGRISATTLSNCMRSGSTASQCQYYETYPGTAGQSYWWELLETPIVQKVHLCTTGTEPDCNGRIDSTGDLVFRVQFTNWAWNMAMDLADSLAILTWELDTDTDKITPVSLESDSTILNLQSGPYGAVAGGNAPLSNGFPVFADFSSTATTATSKNGTIGGNHEGKNGCFFEQGGRSTPFGFALPKDDDLRNGWCDNAGDPLDKQTSCTVATQVADCTTPKYHGVCVLDGLSTTDQYVYKNGPLRNMNLIWFNGFTDGRFYTLEDIYGDSGQNFQGAIGLIVQEGTVSTVPLVGFGASIDDMVLEWKESNVVEDTVTNCADPSIKPCATVALSATGVFQGLGLLHITVTDPSPSVNDCNHNGVRTDPGDDNDCNDNGIPDVQVFAFDDVEPTGEWVILDQTSTPNVFAGNLPVSTAYNSPGTLFLQKIGTQDASATVRYEDFTDVAGTVHCANNPDVNKQGIIDTGTAFTIQSGSVVVKGSRITNDAGNGDGDGFADHNETVNMFVTFSNKSGEDLHNVVARLSSNDAKIDCIIKPLISVGTIPNNGSVEGAQAFVFKVAATAIRGAVNQDFSAQFSVTISADEIDTSIAPQTITQDLDLDVTGGAGAGTFTESFEVANGFNTFTSMTLDTAQTTNTLSNGKRCQYSDPDFVNAAGFGQTFCYLGFKNTLNNTFDWHLHKSGTTSPDKGRAYVGSQSLHWGFHKTPGVADNDTTKFSQMDAIRLNAPVNLGYTPVTPGNPELSFKQQVSFMDFRFVTALFMEAPDRGIVSLQLADPGTGTGFGLWNKIYPYENVYDIQTNTNFINCIFDPTDDGNNEDSYFIPTDPNRYFGPSSTCFPEYNFGSIGDTDYRNKFIPGNVNRASDDKVGLKGAIDVGTWVQSKFNLERFRGRSARIRFLATTIKVYDSTDPLALGFPNKLPYDDGWYIDDVQISNTLTTAATMSIDTNNNAGLPACPGNCTSITAGLVASSTSLVSPGQVVDLSAASSSADACIGGTLQFQWWIDGDKNGTLGSGGDTLLRDWSDNSGFTDAPAAATVYGVKVRCSSATSCIGTALSTVAVGCPSSGNAKRNWAGPLSVGKTGGIGGAEPDQNLTLSWPTPLTPTKSDVVRGNLITLRSSAGNYTGTVQACILNDGLITSVVDNTALATGQGFYFLARGVGDFCNEVGTYSSGAPKEVAGRDAKINADPNACP